ncbi:phospholipid carrier-dependent glycosyltransferase [Endozoicomonas acroporae]|uniref:phospholipid carrier-dependent glycosyltransferase n=1 Tax=Endozoicomonas acroporae TaxID=1701104 RepID=UPI003D7A41CD
MPILILLSVFVKVIVLMLQRLIDIGLFFHTDSYYYFNNAKYIIQKDFSFDLVSQFASHDGFYVVVTAFLYHIFESLYPIVGLNIILSSIIPFIIAQILIEIDQSVDRKSSLIAAFIVSVQPYYIHISIHILKDVFFIFFTLSSILFLVRRDFILFLLFFFMSFMTRSYLSGFNLILFLSLGFASSSKLKINFISIILIYLIFVVLIDLAGVLDIFISRGDVYFEGRDFFSSLPVFRVADFVDMFLFGLLSPLKSLLLPNIIFARSFSELMYGIDIFILQTIWLTILIKKKLVGGFTSGEFNLFLFSFGGFWFIEMTTPGYGPLVRYREVYVLVLLYLGIYVLLSRNMIFKLSRD